LTFDGARADKNRTAPAQLTYLRGATHAYFNSKFELHYTNPAEKLRYENGAHLSRAQQEDFFIHYVSHFLDIYAKKNAASAVGTYDINSPEPSKMYGYNVTASFISPGGEKLISPKENSSELYTYGEATAEYVALEVNDFELLFQHGGGMLDYYPLYRLRWKDKTGTVVFKTGPRDFSEFASICLYVSAIPSEELNANGADQALTVALKDSKGKESRVTVSAGTAALSWYPGEKMLYQSLVEEAPEKYYWEGETPLCGLRIPVSFFKGIDLKDVKQLQLEFDQTNSGAIMISEIWAMPPS
jgi:hypothetical protein